MVNLADSTRPAVKVVTLRFPESLAARIERIAKANRVSVSALIRDWVGQASAGSLVVEPAELAFAQAREELVAHVRAALDGFVQSADDRVRAVELAVANGNQAMSQMLAALVEPASASAAPATPNPSNPLARPNR